MHSAYGTLVKLKSKSVLILAAVRRNPETCRALDTEIETAVQDWLRFAKDRDGGRRRREARRLGLNTYTDADQAAA